MKYEDEAQNTVSPRRPKVLVMRYTIRNECRHIMDDSYNGAAHAMERCVRDVLSYVTGLDPESVSFSIED